MLGEVMGGGLGGRGQRADRLAAPPVRPLEESQVTGVGSRGRGEQAGLRGSGNTRHGEGAGRVRRHISGSDDRIRLGSQPQDLWVEELNIFRCHLSQHVCMYIHTFIYYVSGVRVREVK